MVLLPSPQEDLEGGDGTSIRVARKRPIYLLAESVEEKRRVCGEAAVSRRKGKSSSFSIESKSQTPAPSHSMTMATEGEGHLLSRALLLQSLERYSGRRDVSLVGEAEVSRATAGVQGFLSIVLRARVRYRVGAEERVLCKTFFVKREPLSEMLVEFSRRSGIFTREGTYFDGVVPRMRRLSAGKVPIPLPECYLAAYGSSRDAIVMEDLAEDGFRNPDPRFLSEGMDWDHCRIVMERLGVLHGLSVAVERSLPLEAGGWLRAFPPFADEVCFYEATSGKPPSPLTGMVENAIGTILALSKELEGLPREAAVSGKMELVLDGLWPTLCRLVRPDPRGRNVPSHGDCWMNNVMFRYDAEQRPADAKFVDLQVSRYCHPSIDLLYFAYLSTTKTFRESNMDSLLEVYYASMVDALKEVSGGEAPISLQQLRADVHGDYRPFGVIIAAIMTPFFMLGEDLMQSGSERPSSESLDNLLKTGNADSIRERFSRDPKFRSRTEEVLRELVEVAFPRGLDSLQFSPLILQ